MVKLPKPYYWLIGVGLMVALSGCELRRDSNTVSDPGPVSELPTLAPLGSESAELAAEATAIPTVINVQPTVTASPLEPGQAAADPNEPIAPTAEPPSIPTAPAVDTGQAEQATVETQTFTPPVAESAPTEPIVVDATTAELPDGGPIAADPPASQTTGDYAPSTYDDTTYTVQPGDTLFSIGLRYGTTAEAIAYSNGLTSDLIYVGQELTISSGDGSYYPPVAYAPTGPGNGDDLYHIVAPGETLFRIALNYGTSVDAIAGANGIPYPYIIQIGQRLLIPAYGTNPGLPPPPAEGYYSPNPGYPPQGPAEGYYPPNPGYPPQGPAEGYYPPPDNGDAMPGEANTHTVAPGETLYSISVRYGVSAMVIAEANGLSNPNQIYVGQVLYLP